MTTDAERPSGTGLRALQGAKDDIRARIREFTRLGADPQYLNALNDAWGLVANRQRDLERSTAAHPDAAAGTGLAGLSEEERAQVIMGVGQSGYGSWTPLMEAVERIVAARVAEAKVALREHIDHVETGKAGGKVLLPDGSAEGYYIRIEDWRRFRAALSADRIAADRDQGEAT